MFLPFCATLHVLLLGDVPEGRWGDLFGGDSLYNVIFGFLKLRGENNENIYER